MPVTRCVCKEVPLEDVAREARAMRARGLPVSLAELCDRTLAGTGCGTCRPYMARAAITGESIQPVMSPADSEVWIRRLSAVAHA